MTSGTPKPTAQVALLSLAFFAFGTGCERLPEKVEISETREISQYEPAPSLEATANDRLGRSRVLSILPKGWIERASTESRLLSFNFGNNNEGEVYLSVLQSPDETDFVIPNIDRWRKQMGQPPMNPAEVDSLPEITFFTRPAKKVVIDGSYTPMGSTEPRPGFRLMGAILQIPQFTFFVKMIGPKALVSDHEKKFDEFTSTLQFR